MEESDIDNYNLSSEERKQTLRVSLINNQFISLIIVNISTEQKYTAFVTLPQLKQICKIFNSIKTEKEALSILKKTIESGGIILTEDLKENVIELRFNMNINDNEEEENDIFFDVNLTLEQKINSNSENEKNKNIEQTEKKEEKDFEELPPDFKGNKEGETKYGYTSNNTTEYVKPIIQSNVNKPLLELEIIEPIVQMHYPDGTTKSKALPPRIQGPGGEEITEEQLKTLQEQMDNNSTIRNFSPLKELLKNRSNSVVKKNLKTISSYSIQSTPSYQNSNFNNNITRVNPLNNNNESYKTTSEYSSMTLENKKAFIENNNNLAKVPNPTIFNNNLKRTNKNNKIIERRPRMINNLKKNNKDNQIKDKDNKIQIGVRSTSTPHQNFAKFNQKNNNQNNYYNKSQNEYINHNEKFPFDRNTQRNKLKPNNNLINNSLNNNSKNIQVFQFSKDKINDDDNIKQQIRSNNQNENLSKIELQQLRLKEVQEKLAYIQKQQQELQERQRELALRHQMKKNILVSSRSNYNNNHNLLRKTQSQPIDYNNQLFNQKNNISQIQLQQIQQNNDIKQINSLTNNQTTQTQFMKNHQIKQVKSQTNLGFRTQNSTDIPSLENNINQKLLNYDNKALDKKHKEFLEEKKEEKDKEMVDENHEYQSNEYNEGNTNQENDTNNNTINIEALFFTEDGRVIFRNGLLRGIIHQYAEIDDIVGKIQDSLLKGVKFTLVYKAFDADVGDSSKIFHERCDKLKMSLVLIETDKDIRFGGFTTKSWGGNCLKKIDNKAFVFNLDNNKIYDVINNEPAIGCYPKFGPVFFGCQIRIYDEFFTKGGTTCHKGLNYRTTLDYELNNGEQKFFIKDIEVYNIETVDI